MCSGTDEYERYGLDGVAVVAVAVAVAETVAVAVVAIAVAVAEAVAIAVVTIAVAVTVAGPDVLWSRSSDLGYGGDQKAAGKALSG